MNHSPLSHAFAAILFTVLLTRLGRAETPTNAEAINQAMSPGINYGNIFEADPPEGWGLTGKEGDFKIIAAAGFKGVRIPVRWSAKAAVQAPYAIDPAFIQRIDHMVNAALGSGLYVIINMHHYEDLFENPEANHARFLELWKQIAHHYSRYPRTLLFEIMNEPHDKLTPALWNSYYQEALAAIRKENPDRVVMIGSAKWGGPDALSELQLPRDDKNIIVTFHDYSPFHFTHQGANWVGEQSKAWLGTKWTGSTDEMNEMRGEFEKVKTFTRSYDFPINMGEFGSISNADMPSRVRWTAAMSNMAKRYGYSRFYWEFKAGGFGAYDETAGQWRDELKDAIVK